MAIELRPVENSSGNVKAAGYDPDDRIMRVEFANGNKYDYHEVSSEVWETFNDAPSAGEYLNKVIKPACPASKVKEDKNADQ